jgi:hypothetical protein
MHAHNTVNIGLQDASAEKSQRVSNIANRMPGDGLSVDECLFHVHASTRLVLTRM